ncbi:MAG: alanine--tRNA ligase-related protein, partial [Terriglobia bacterium]
RILADHSRAAAFLIHDGVLPANDGRGYVLRKILRRAARHGKMLGLNDPFLYQLTGKVAEIMSDAYPELLESTQRVAAVVKSEEQRFAHTMTVALQEFEKVVNEAKGVPTRGSRTRSGSEGRTHSTSQGHSTSTSGRTTLPGEKLFRLYDTFGMPLDWIDEMATERGLTVDVQGFEEEMQRQRRLARASWKGIGKATLPPAYSKILQRGRPVFEGYQQTLSNDCVVVGLIRYSEEMEMEGEISPGLVIHGRKVQFFAEEDKIPAGTRAELVLDHTPFYAEAGGQVGDSGVLIRDGTGEVVANVEDTYSPVSGLIAHRITTRAPIRVGDRLTAVVDAEKRRATMRNHTGTHLLNAALRQVLGTHVKQAGSVVDPDRLRFDFSHFASVSEDELQEIERLANDAIVRNAAVATEVMELDRALDSGALAFFGEKYPDRVRVVTVPDFSKELCGGTHVSRTGDIGLLKVTSEGSISAGVRRVEAVTGERALGEFQAVTGLVHRVAAALKT